MIHGQTTCLRTIVQSNKFSIESIRTKIAIKVLSLANTYTGARYSDPPTTDEVRVLGACTKSILRDYLYLSMDELEEAFSLATSGKLGDLKIQAYYGTFTPQIMGTILTAYSLYRKKVLGAHSEQLLLESFERRSNLDSILKAELNDTAKHQILTSYIDVMFEHNENPLEFDRNKVKKSWSNVLFKTGIIKPCESTFNQAKKECIEDLQREKVASARDFNKRKSLEYILKRVENGEIDTNFTGKVIAKYSVLLIIKSFT